MTISPLLFILCSDAPLHLSWLSNWLTVWNFPCLTSPGVQWKSGSWSSLQLNCYQLCRVAFAVHCTTTAHSKRLESFDFSTLKVGQWTVAVVQTEPHLLLWDTWSFLFCSANVEVNLIKTEWQKRMEYCSSLESFLMKSSEKQPECES